MARAVRRDLRRAVGADALATIGEAQSNIERLANSEQSLDARLKLVERQVSDERTARLQLAHEQRSYVDNEDRLLRQCCQGRWDATTATTKRLADRASAFEHQTFWQRLRWLFRGR